MALSSLNPGGNKSRDMFSFIIHALTVIIACSSNHTGPSSERFLLTFGVDQVWTFSASFPQVCGTPLRADYSRMAVQARLSATNLPKLQNTDHKEASTYSTCYSTSFTAGEIVGFDSSRGGAIVAVHS
jgi:hypothetical protein